MLLNRHFWASVYVWWWLCMETHHCLSVFWCFGWLRTCSGRDWVGKGCVSFSQWQCAGEIESTAEHSYWMLSRLDIAHRKWNIALVSKRIKLVPEREWVSRFGFHPFWSTESAVPSWAGVCVCCHAYIHNMLTHTWKEHLPTAVLCPDKPEPQTCRFHLVSTVLCPLSKAAKKHGGSVCNSDVRHVL